MLIQLRLRGGQLQFPHVSLVAHTCSTACRTQYGQFFVSVLSFSEGQLSYLIDISDDSDT